jgi:hypothetical protein
MLFMPLKLAVRLKIAQKAELVVTGIYAEPASSTESRLVNAYKLGELLKGYQEEIKASGLAALVMAAGDFESYGLIDMDKPILAALGRSIPAYPWKFVPILAQMLKRKGNSNNIKEVQLLQEIMHRFGVNLLDKPEHASMTVPLPLAGGVPFSLDHILRVGSSAQDNFPNQPHLDSRQLSDHAGTSAVLGF